MVRLGVRGLPTYDVALELRCWNLLLRQAMSIDKSW